MADAEADRANVPPGTAPARGRPAWMSGMACLAMILLVGFIGQSGSQLWGEWDSLRQDRVRERDSAVVGYLNITPNPSYAEPPPDWLRDEGDHSLLWAGWKKGEHRWFRIGLGEIEASHMSKPIGMDSIIVVDHPIFEQRGGEFWSRVPRDARVAGFEKDGVALAYPLKVLDKVEVVNDEIQGKPVLVVLTPVIDIVTVFDASSEGRRVTLGHSGYFRGDNPVLYDRGTRSLWSEIDGGMVAIAGRRKGAILKPIARMGMTVWGDWRDGHPGGRLLVGADRSRATPVD